MENQPVIKSEPFEQPSPTPKIISLYGIPGSGTTYLMHQLQQHLDDAHFAFFEGSEIINKLVPGGLAAFKSASDDAKTDWRHKAITHISHECATSGKVGIVTGHFILGVQQSWNQGMDISRRREQDLSRPDRPQLSPAQLDEWQIREARGLRDICREHDMLFSVNHPGAIDTMVELLNDFRDHNAELNLARAKDMLNDIVLVDGESHHLETMLVFYADKTLAAEDAGALFWREIDGREQTLKDLFSSPLGYSYTAFRQATLLCESFVTDGDEYEAQCEKVASRITIRPQFTRLLQEAERHKHVGAVVVTCGYRLIWEKVLAKAGLSWVKVIGGGRLSDGIVVTAALKGDLITHMQEYLRLHVWAFGDSPLDLDMLRRADQAVVVVGEEGGRSKSMDAQLADAVDGGGLRAYQVPFPSTALPRLDSVRLPLLQLDGALHDKLFNNSLKVFHATETTASKLLTAPTRDSALAGPALREAHRRIGWHLATEYLTQFAVIGLESHDMTSVQDRTIEGHRLLNEAKTIIIPLMRGGEPMAFGVNDAFPLAMFRHASNVSDIAAPHLEGQTTVILVDSVVNSGKSIAEFVHHIRELQPGIRIVVVAGVVQKSAVEDRSQFRLALRGGEQVIMVALRLSDNKFTGSGATDTGNRLFNTTQLPDKKDGGKDDSVFARTWRRLGAASCL